MAPACRLKQAPGDPRGKGGDLTTLELTAVVASGSFVAGGLGALTGLGGGVVLVPLLVLGLGVDVHYAVGASLVSVIATSSGAAAAYVREGYTNLRIGMLLEIATTTGALAGASLATRVSAPVVAGIFGAVLLWSALTPAPHLHPDTGARPGRLAARLRLTGTVPELEGERPYAARNVPAGFALMSLAGVLSGLLGIGSGAVKALAMDRAMRLPFKVSTTTSNFMIGVTAAASAGIYLSRGYVDPVLAAPVTLGVLAGSLLGARFLVRAPTRMLRGVFRLVLLALAAEMIRSAWTGRI